MEFWCNEKMFKEIVDPPRTASLIYVDNNGKELYREVFHGTWEETIYPKNNN